MDMVLVATQYATEQGVFMNIREVVGRGVTHLDLENGKTGQPVHPALGWTSCVINEKGAKTKTGDQMPEEFVL